MIAKELPKEIEERKIGSIGPEHLLIEGDNFKSLQVLQRKFKEKIDLIYIDPPYNTKNYGLKYNDSIDSNLWALFMRKRLLLAKSLLSPSGAIFISIDDNELATLKTICDQVFGKENFIANFIRKCKSGSGHSSHHIAIEFDYMLCYALDKKKLTFKKQQLNPANDKRYQFEDDHLQRRGKYYLRDLCYKGNYSKSLDYQIELPNGDLIYPGGKFGKPYLWRWSEQKFKWGIKNDYIVFRERKNGFKIYIKQYQFVDNNDQLIERSIPYRAMLEFSNGKGTSALKKILPKVSFPYPKPPELIEFLLQLIDKKDAIILDFFAGSGTTLHATLNQNKKDAGSRKCILITSNENRICEEITYERGKRLIQGYFDYKGDYIKGMNDNQLRYFKTH